MSDSICGALVLNGSSVVTISDGGLASCNRYVDSEDVTSILDKTEDVVAVFSIFD